MFPRFFISRNISVPRNTVWESPRYSKASSPALGATTPPIQRLARALSPSVKRPKREGGHSPPPRRLRLSGAIPPCPHIPSWRAKEQLHLLPSHTYSGKDLSLLPVSKYNLLKKRTEHKICTFFWTTFARKFPTSERQRYEQKRAYVCMQCACFAVGLLPKIGCDDDDDDDL